MFEYDRLALDVLAASSPFSHNKYNADNNTTTATSDFSSNGSLSATATNGALTTATERQKIFPVESEETGRRLSGGSTLSYSEAFDCGASSGYGSPGWAGTPLASPAPNSSVHVVNQLQMPWDQGFCEAFINNSGRILNFHIASSRQFSSPTVCAEMEKNIWRKLSCDDNFNSSAVLTSSSTPLATNHRFRYDNSPSPKAIESVSRRNTSSSSTSSSAGVTPPAAVEDGFTSDDIEQFAQLLSSPKKAPPSRYQCHICYQTGHYISDCPMRFNSPYEELTPYQGRKKCYGEFQCQQCKRKWTSQNSVANEAQSCIKCHIPVFPHKQLPVDKAVALGLVKTQHVVPTKITPIGHGRPPIASVQ